MPRIIQFACAVLALLRSLEHRRSTKPIGMIAARHNHITNWTRDSSYLKMDVTFDNPNDLWVKYCFYGPGIPSVVHKDESSHEFSDVEGISACPGFLFGGYWFDVPEYSQGVSYTCYIMEIDPV